MQQFNSCLGSEAPLEKITRGISGLKNASSICYMNALLQALNCTDTFMGMLIHPKCNPMWIVKKNILAQNNHEITSFNDYAEHIDKKARQTITLTLRKLFIYMWSENSVISPISFANVVAKLMQISETNKNFSQHDVHELFTALINAIYSETKELCTISHPDIPHESDLIRMCAKKTIQSNIFSEYSKFKNIFTFIELSTVECQNCKTKSYTTDIQNTIFVPLLIDNKAIESAHLTELLDKNYAVELLEGDNMYYCENCKSKQITSKQLSLVTCPDKLVIFIKKSIINAADKPIKCETVVKYDFKLSMSKYISKQVASDYELYAGIFHVGKNAQFGHYCAFCKNPINGEWFCYNDEIVHWVHDKNIVLLADCCMLFYQLATGTTSC